MGSLDPHSDAGGEDPMEAGLSGGIDGTQKVVIDTLITAVGRRYEEVLGAYETLLGRVAEE